MKENVLMVVIFDLPPRYAVGSGMGNVRQTAHYVVNRKQVAHTSVLAYLLKEYGISKSDAKDFKIVNLYFIENCIFLDMKTQGGYISYDVLLIPNKNKVPEASKKRGATTLTWGDAPLNLYSSGFSSRVVLDAANSMPNAINMREVIESASPTIREEWFLSPSEAAEIQGDEEEENPLG